MEIPGVPMPTVAVAVFAHNEVRNILRCLDSLGPLGPTRTVTVLANGCTDATESVVRAANRSHVTLVSIAAGDKVNAHNVFVHDLAPPVDVAVFIDGDVCASPGAIDALLATLERNPDAHAATAVPGPGGRNEHLLRQQIVERHQLHGNLYALTGTFLELLRRGRLRMPFGYIRDDGLIGEIAKSDGAFLQTRIPSRIAPCLEAQYLYESLRPWSRRDARLYWRRRLRYAEGYFQRELLVRHFGTPGARMPATIQELYTPGALVTLRPRRSGGEFLFDFVALQRLRQSHWAEPVKVRA